MYRVRELKELPVAPDQSGRSSDLNVSSPEGLQTELPVSDNVGHVPPTLDRLQGLGCAEGASTEGASTEGGNTEDLNSRQPSLGIAESLSVSRSEAREMLDSEFRPGDTAQEEILSKLL